MFGLDKVKTVKGETRIANVGDPAALLDGSAERYTHQNPMNYLKGGGPHDYHEGIARFNSGFGPQNTAVANKPGTDFDKSCRNPFNLTSNFTWQAPKIENTQQQTSWQNPDGSTSLIQ